MDSPSDVVGRYLRALERRDHAVLERVVAVDVVVRKPNGDVAFSDRAAWLEGMASTPFTDERIVVEDVVSAGDKVAVRYSLECEHTGEALGVRPTGKRITSSGTKIYRVRNGEIVEISGHDDILGVLQQLGVVDVSL